MSYEIKHGLILIDKPLGITSREATTQVSKIFSQKKAGHLGTLDPLATGLLPVLLGSATRLASFLEDAPKQYLAKIKLGQATTTFDLEGEVIFSAPVPRLSKEEVNEILKRFIGEIKQIPPLYSALKHQGKRLYQLARQGVEIKPKARVVKIFEIELKSFTGDELEIFVHCGSGTYLRVLADDLGKALKCGAHLVSLKRLKVGNFSLEKAIGLDKLNSTNCLNFLIPLEEILDYEKVLLSEELGFKLKDGVSLPLRTLGIERSEGTLIRVFSSPCFAIAKIINQQGELFLKPLKVFSRE